jgi:Rrf2 family protein
MVRCKSPLPNEQSAEESRCERAAALFLFHNVCMLLTRAADYAVRVMIHLAALPAGERRSLPALAAATQVPPSFLSKVLQHLTRAGLILSRRGADGGFEILPKGRASTLRNVIEAIDGPLFLNVCLTSGESCENKGRCPAHRVWNRAQQGLMQVLDSTSMEQMAAAPDPELLQQLP